MNIQYQLAYKATKKLTNGIAAHKLEYNIEHNFNMIYGMYFTLIAGYKLKNNIDTIEGFKDAYFDSIEPGVEYEFLNDSSYDKWKSLTPEHMYDYAKSKHNKESDLFK